MSSRTKRRLEDFDPNASDPNDSDFDVRETRSPQKRRNKHTASSVRRPNKRRRRNYADSDDDIVDDDEEISEESYDSESEPEEDDEEDAPVNPRTGRRVRGAASKAVKYEEPDSDVEETIEDSDKDHDKRSTRRGDRQPEKPSLIIKLKIPSWKQTMTPNTRITRQGSRARTTTPGPKAPAPLGIRRSSRISHDDQEPIIALTSSGKHAEIIRPGTKSPTPGPEIGKRQTRGGKGVPLKKPPSAIMEASQENSHPSAEDAPHEEEDLFSSLKAQADLDAQVASSDVELGYGGDTQPDPQDEERLQMSGVIQESVHGDDDDDDDEGPITRAGRSLRSRNQTQPAGRSSTRNSQKRKRSDGESSDFEPGGDDEGGADEDMSESDAAGKRAQRGGSTDSGAGRRSRRVAKKSSQHSQESDDDGEEPDSDEVAEEADELQEENAKRRRRSSRRARDNDLVYDEPAKSTRRRTQKVDYRIIRPETVAMIEEDDDLPATAPSRSRGGATKWERTLFPLAGPFGGHTTRPLFGGPEGTGAAGGVDSDSSDDDAIVRGVQGIGGAVGMTPTTANAPQLFPQPHNTDPLQAGKGTGAPDNFGKIKDKKLLADADPLGVDVNVTFDGVGGLDNHINKLREMVMLPLLYPEIFLRFKTTPPRGVLFHGPPGTGKTLLARALASSVSSQGKKVTFYMRKGADALSKWVGEAERQLRLLFEEARKNQPSIIFFDEIDGLAPVRSSKQEQIHASIVATLLALMDGMDGRGQVIVIGATNRPDSVDPALRRPGRFDREFYFPLPDVKGRRSIIDIHTKNWDPPLAPAFKDQLAELTNGYGGADLRALCTEAALNAVQGTYPQIYSSNEKLVIEPSKIKVLAKDFMISVNKMIPSSERSGSAAAQPLSKGVQPLLRKTLDDVMKILDEVIPRRKQLTALEEAMYDDRDDSLGFERETMQRDFERSRVYRPRLLISGIQGMGQQYLGPALLNKLEQLHVQTFDLPTLLEDSGRAPEAAVVQLFKEAKRHKPSIIFIPDVEVWYTTLSDAVRATFLAMLRKLPPNDPVLVLGIMELASEDDKPDPHIMRDLFGFSKKNIYVLDRPHEPARREYFENIIAYIRKPPAEFPNPENRVKRKLPELPVAPPDKAPEVTLTKEELKAQKKRDRHMLNQLKLAIQPVMNEIKKNYRQFRLPLIEESRFGYLFDEQDPGVLTTDLSEEQRQAQAMDRPYELATDKFGVPGLREVASGKFYYNLDITIIEKRLSNGYYTRFKDFEADIRRLAKDATTLGDEQRAMKANEMLTNVEVDMMDRATQNPALAAELEAIHARQQAREREAAEKAKKTDEGQGAPRIEAHVASNTSGSTDTTGPIVLGEPVPGRAAFLPPITPKNIHLAQSHLSNGDSTSNGDGSHPTHQSNGSVVPSRFQEDIVMENSQDVPLAPAIRTPAPPYFTPSHPNTQSRLSQQTSIQRMAPGTQPTDYHNSASTTTSGQKTSDRSNRTSDRSNFNNTQSTNGLYPDFNSIPPMIGGSQIPDTQGRFPLPHAGINNSFDSIGSSNSEPSDISTEYPSSQQTGSQASQAPMAAPARPAAAREMIAPPNLAQHHVVSASASGTTRPDPATAANSTNPVAITSILNEEKPTLILEDSLLHQLHGNLVEKSSGCSVEQLEQINAALMDAVWKSRMKWNRNAVIAAVEDAFNRTLADVEEMQRILKPSQETERGTYA